MEKKKKFELRTPFTRDQSEWLQDIFGSLMMWEGYETKAHSKVFDKVKHLLDEVKEKTYQREYFTNPTSGEIRCDRAGDGAFCASRGYRLHDGEDYECTPGQPVVAVMTGKLSRLVYPYADKSYGGVEICNDLFIAHLLYLDPIKEIIGRKVAAGTVIGYAQDITERYADQGMTPHIHTRIYIKPSLFIR